MSNHAEKDEMQASFLQHAVKERKKDSKWEVLFFVRLAHAGMPAATLAAGCRPGQKRAREGGEGGRAISTAGESHALLSERTTGTPNRMYHRG